MDNGSLMVDDDSLVVLRCSTTSSPTTAGCSAGYGWSTPTHPTPAGWRYPTTAGPSVGTRTFPPRPGRSPRTPRCSTVDGSGRTSTGLAA